MPSQEPGRCGAGHVGSGDRPAGAEDTDRAVRVDVRGSRGPVITTFLAFDGAVKSSPT